MAPQKTPLQREKELQALLATPAGREEFQQLAARSSAAGGWVRRERTSVLTYILVDERGRGLVGG